MAYDVLNTERVIRAVLTDGSRVDLTLADSIRRCDEIAIIDEYPLTRMALTAFLGVLLLEALEHSGVVDKKYAEDDPEEALIELYDVPQESIREAIDAYASTASAREWFDLDNPHGMGQTDACAFPPKANEDGKISSLDHTYAVDKSSHELLDRKRVSLAILTLPYRGMMRDSAGIEGAETYLKQGLLLRGAMSFAECETFRDTLLSSITTEVLTDTSAPAWVAGPPDHRGDVHGTRITGPRAALTLPTRIPWVKFDSSGLLEVGCVTGGDCITDEKAMMHVPMLKLVLRQDDTGVKIKSPVSNYGKVHAPPFEHVSAVAATSTTERNRAVDAAARYASHTGKHSVRVTTLTLVHTNLSKISSIAADTFAYPVTLFPSAVVPQMRETVLARGAQVSQCASRALNCAGIVRDTIRVIDKAHRDVNSKSASPAAVANAAYDELLADISIEFKSWVEGIPQLPESAGDVDTLMESYVSEWNKIVFDKCRDRIDAYLRDMPQDRWITVTITAKVGTLSVAEYRNYKVGAVRKASGMPAYEPKDESKDKVTS